MKFTPQKLYKINEYFWFLYPTKETAMVARAFGAPDESVCAEHTSSVSYWAAYWSKELNCDVFFLSEGDMIMVVEVSGRQVKVINREGVSGWINFPGTDEWTKGTITEAFNELP
jgi:hypothetical protein